MSHLRGYFVLQIFSTVFQSIYLQHTVVNSMKLSRRMRPSDHELGIRMLSSILKNLESKWQANKHFKDLCQQCYVNVRHFAIGLYQDFLSTKIQ